jgi:hypothetical protein
MEDLMRQTKMTLAQAGTILAQRGINVQSIIVKDSGGQERFQLKLNGTPLLAIYSRKSGHPSVSAARLRSAEARGRHLLRQAVA